MSKKKALKNQGLEFREDIVTSGGGVCDPNWNSGCNPVGGWNPGTCPSAGTFCFGDSK